MAEEKPEEKVTAYCVKCKAKKEMKDPEEVSMKGKGGTKRRAMKRTCPDCGTKMFRILGKAK
jgi:Zn finger protein HypA/HybF involved in hydrogenase expression